MIHTLIQESKKRGTLMESAALGSRELSVEELKEAVHYITANPDYTAYHLLFALRRQSSETYKSIPDSIKARVLTDALKESTYLNDWGYLDLEESYDGETAGALLEFGRTALLYLLPILDDDHKAPLFGTEEATLSSMYKYRRKDFAYRYIALILGLPASFAEEPEKRDEFIDAIKKNKELDNFLQSNTSD